MTPKIHFDRIVPAWTSTERPTLLRCAVGALARITTNSTTLIDNHQAHPLSSKLAQHSPVRTRTQKIPKRSPRNPLPAVPHRYEPPLPLASHTQPRPPQCQIPPVPRHQTPLHPEICLSSICTTPPTTYQKPCYPADGTSPARWLELGLGSRQNLRALLTEPGSPSSYPDCVCRPAGFPRVQTPHTQTK